MRHPIDLSHLSLEDPRRDRRAAVLRLGERAMGLAGASPRPSAAVLVAGSGRSGTTWVSEVLARSPRVQQIFEPLNPVWIPEARRLTGWDSRRLHPRAHYLHPSDRSVDWESFFERALTGKVRSGWTDPLRTSLFPRRFVVKLIRANLMLGWIEERFHPRIVLVARHPCAVVASRLELGWTAATEDLLRQERLVEEHLRPWVPEIERERRPAAIHAIGWAVENLVAHQQLQGRPHRRVLFEELVANPVSRFHEILAWVGLRPPRHLERILRRPSTQTPPARSHDSPAARSGAWRDRLSPEDIGCVLDWCRRLGADGLVWNES